MVYETEIRLGVTFRDGEETESITGYNNIYRLHSFRCMHAFFCEVHGNALNNLEKSNIFNLRCQKVCLQCK